LSRSFIVIEGVFMRYHLVTGVVLLLVGLLFLYLRFVSGTPLTP